MRDYSGQNKSRQAYERWWLGKMCRPSGYTNKPFRMVVKIDLIGPPSFVYGQITLHYQDGNYDAVSGHGHKPTKTDVEVQG